MVAIVVVGFVFVSGDLITSCVPAALPSASFVRVKGWGLKLTRSLPPGAGYSRYTHNVQKMPLFFSCQHNGAVCTQHGLQPAKGVSWSRGGHHSTQPRPVVCVLEPTTTARMIAHANKHTMRALKFEIVSSQTSSASHVRVLGASVRCGMLQPSCRSRGRTDSDGSSRPGERLEPGQHPQAAARLDLPPKRKYVEGCLVFAPDFQ